MADPRNDIARFIRDNDGFLVASHVSPDGDALGSTAAVGHILRALGKSFYLYNPSGMSAAYEWLPMPGELRDELPASGYENAIIVDCGALNRAGEELAARLDPARTVNIDHHRGNPLFGAINWADFTYSSTGEMVAELADLLGVPLTGDLAACVYTALVTDTGYFSFSYTRPETHELAARLMRGGLDCGAINIKIQNNWTENRIRLWTEVLSGLTFHDHGRVGAIAIPRSLFDKTGAKVEDCDGLINYALRVKGMRAAVSVRENLNGQIKFSLRSTGGLDVQRIAAKFGGGGHKNAAGGSLDLPILEAQRVLIDEAVQALSAGTHD